MHLYDSQESICLKKDTIIYIYTLCTYMYMFMYMHTYMYNYVHTCRTEYPKAHTVSRSAKETT